MLSCKFPFFLISFYLKFIILGRRKLNIERMERGRGKCLKRNQGADDCIFPS